MKFEFFRTDDGVKLGYVDKGSGIPVILMAGYSAPATSWHREEKTLLKHGSGSSLVVPIVGHVGDGNFHMLMLVDPTSPDDRKQNA